MLQVGGKALPDDGQDDNHVVTRRELARLIDRALDPFSRAIGFDGNYKE